MEVDDVVVLALAVALSNATSATVPVSVSPPDRSSWADPIRVPPVRCTRAGTSIAGRVAPYDVVNYGSGTGDVANADDGVNDPAGNITGCETINRA